MLVMKDNKKIDQYAEELKNLIRRAAAEGTHIAVHVNTEGVTGSGPVTDYTPELNLREDQVRVRNESICIPVDTPELMQHGISGVVLDIREVYVHDYSQYTSVGDPVKDYKYVHTPGVSHPLPTPIDYSCYYKNDPTNPVNWLNPKVTVNAAAATDFVLLDGCCEQIDKFCNNDTWKGNLHTVVTTVIEDLIQQNKLKYIG